MVFPNTNKINCEYPHNSPSLVDNENHQPRLWQDINFFFSKQFLFLLLGHLTRKLHLQWYYITLTYNCSWTSLPVCTGWKKPSKYCIYKNYHISTTTLSASVSNIIFHNLFDGKKGIFHARYIYRSDHIYFKTKPILS